MKLTLKEQRLKFYEKLEIIFDKKLSGEKKGIISTNIRRYCHNYSNNLYKRTEILEDMIKKLKSKNDKLEVIKSNPINNYKEKQDIRVWKPNQFKK